MIMMSRRNLTRIIHEIGTATEDRVFERFFADIQIRYYENKEAKASQGGTTGNERKYSILGLFTDISE